MSTAKSIKRSPLLVNLMSLVYFLVVFGLVWVPFGIKKTIPLYEEWYFAYVVDVAPLKAIVLQSTRPIFLWPYFIAHLLTPDSFAGMNLLLITIFVLKAVFIYRLVRHFIPDNSFLALMTATLGVIYPADMGLLSFRALSYHAALLLAIMAIYFFVVGWNKTQPRRYWIIIWPLQLIILGTYEALYPVIFAAPMLLLWQEKTFTRPLRDAARKWLLLPSLLLLLTAASVLFGVGGYINDQIDLTQKKEGPELIEEYTDSVEHMYSSHLQGWSDILKEWDWDSSYTRLALLAGIITAVVSWFHLSINPAKLENHHQRRQDIWLILAGLSIMLLGFLAFIPSPFNHHTFRVFYATSVGAGLIASTLMSVIARTKYIGRLLAVLVASTAITLATFHMLKQHEFFADTSEDVGYLYAKIMEEAPSIHPNVTLFVIDENDQYQDEWHLASHSVPFQGGLRYLYKEEVSAKICVMDFPRVSKICEFRDEGVYFLDNNAQGEGVIPYDRAIVFRTTWNGGVELLEEIPSEYLDGRHIDNYDPHALIDDVAVPERTFTSLAVCWPPEKCEQLIPDEPQSALILEFDERIRGFGWEYPNYDPTHLWMTNEVVSIHSWLTADRDLPIQFKVTIALDNAVLQQLKLAVNGDPIALTLEPRSDGYYFTGMIPQAALARNLTSTTLLFSVDRLIVPAELGLGPDERHLGLQFDSLTIGYTCWPSSLCEHLAQNAPQDSLVVEFDQPVNGLGWESPNTETTNLWMTNTVATLQSWLAADQDLPIRFRIGMTLAPDVLESLKLTVNGDPIALSYETRSDGYYFSGTIPQSALMREPNHTMLMFFVNRLVVPVEAGFGADERHLALLFDSLEIGN